MGELSYFAEEISFQGTQFRQKRKTVCFRIVSIGKIGRKRVDHTFEADYGVYFDPDDVYITAILNHEIPTIKWDKFLFFRNPNLSRIDVIDLRTDAIVAQIVVRRRMGGDSQALEDDTTNLVVMEDFRRARDKKSVVRDAETPGE